MDQRISAITLGVANLEKAKSFYQSLGWKPANDNPQVVFFQLNGFVLALFPSEELAKDAQVDLKKGPSNITLAHNLSSKAEVDAFFKRVEHAGAKILKPPQDVFWGGYSGYFCDPDGHLWEAAWNPNWPIDENGNTTYGE